MEDNFEINSSEPQSSETIHVPNILDLSKYQILNSSEGRVAVEPAKDNFPKENWKPEFLLSEYVRYTDSIIGRMDGSIPIRHQRIFIPEDTEGKSFRSEIKHLPPPESVIYLDKSARPVEWMVRELWPVLARVPGTQFADNVIPPKPKEYFLNIDRKNWLARMQVDKKFWESATDDLVDFSKMRDLHEQITRIRALYSTYTVDEENLEDAWNHPTRLDNQHVMIIDEVQVSGQSLKIAQKLMSLAVPNATFSGHYWMLPNLIQTSKTNIDAKVNANNAVWYKLGQHATGRDIFDVDPDWPTTAENINKPSSRVRNVGKYVLSSPVRDLSTNLRVDKDGIRVIDEDGEALRKDIEQMAIDLKAGRVFYQPDPDRSDEDFESRIMEINDLTMEQWRQRRNELKPKSRT